MKSVFLCALNNIACNDLSKAITLNLNEINESFPILKITNKLSDIKTYLNRGLTYIIHSGFISGYQNRYGDNLKPPTNVYHRMTA